jgi:hypothetical protein
MLSSLNEQAEQGESVFLSKCPEGTDSGGSIHDPSPFRLFSKYRMALNASTANFEESW